MLSSTLDDRLRQSPNTRHFTCPYAGDTVKTRNGDEISIDQDVRLVLDKKKSLLDQLHDVDMAHLSGTVASWAELQSQGMTVFEEHVTAKQCAMTPKQVDAILHAATAGAGQIGAFLRVIPEVVANVEQQKVRHIAQRSLSTMMNWSSFSKSADGALTCIVVNRLPPDYLTTRQQYTGLSFNPDYFTYNESKDRVTLNYELLDQNHRDKIDQNLHGNNVYFGCPFRRYIPKFYRAMLQTAIRSELL